MWRKHLPIKVLAIEENYIVLQLSCNGMDIMIINVYIRSVSWENESLHAYMEGFQDLEDILTNYRFNNVFFIGDFNADPYIGRAWNNVVNFMKRNSLHCLDVDQLDDSTFTYIPYCGSYTKWLDHIICDSSDSVRINSCNVLYDRVGSDHLPLATSVTFDFSNYIVDNIINETEQSGKRIMWDKVSHEDMKYMEDIVLRYVKPYLRHESISCHEVGCQSPVHRNELEEIYQALVNAMDLCCEEFGSLNVKKCKYTIIPGWNRTVKPLYAEFKENYKQWLRKGKPKYSNEYDVMVHSRKVFKDALRQCRNNKKSEISQSIQENLKNKNMIQFWKEVKSQSNKIKSSKVIDGECKTSDVIQIFEKKFIPKYDEGNDEEETEFIRCLKIVWGKARKFNPVLSIERLRDIISNMNKGVGHDGFHSMLLKQCSDELSYMLSCFLNACYSHCYIPVHMLRGDITPIIKKQ